MANGLWLAAFLAARAAALEARPMFPRPAIPLGEPPALSSELRRCSLWEGAQPPMALSAERARLLSPDAQRSQAPADKALGLPGAGQPGELFVALELDLKQRPADLKDALTAISESGGFRPDGRFQPMPARQGAGLKVWGWLPASRLAETAKARSVLSVEIERSAQRPPSHAEASEEVLIGVRRLGGVAEPAADVAFARAMRALADEAGFSWKRTLGYQQIPGSRDTAILVVGQLPMRRLSRLLAEPDVVKVMPWPGAAERMRLPRPTPKRFLFYVAAQAPMLIVVTVILLFLPLKRKRARTASFSLTNA